jgi:hypothetical protein
MAMRSLKASPEGIKRAKTAMTAHKLTHEELAHDIPLLSLSGFSYYE